MMYSTCSARTGVVLACAFLCNTALAAPDEKEANIVVTANRRPVSVDETFQSVSVIRREDIESRNPQTVMDLLTGLPGLHVNRNGGPGRATSVMMRGANSNQVLVLVDGLRASDLSTGEFDWNSILPEQIERIEVVRGPLASLYGSDAVAGVIQIFTRQPAKGLALEQTLGSYGTRQTSASLAGGDDWRYAMTVGTRHTDGMKNLINNPRLYSFDQKNVGLQLSRQFTVDTRVKFLLNRAEGENAFDSGPTRFSSFSRSVAVDQRLSSVWTQSVKLGWSGSALNVPHESPPGKFETERRSVSWHNHIQAGQGDLVLGADAWTENAIKLDYDNAGNNIDKNLRNSAVFGQYAFEWERLKWQLAARHDHQNYYGTANTYNVGVGRQFGQGWQWNASYGTAFKAPTTNDLFWPHSVETAYDWSNPSNPVALSASSGTCGPTVISWGAPTPCLYDTAGNLNLRPETSKTSEIGLRYAGDFRMGFNYFETQVKDLISWDSRYGGAGENYAQYWYPNNLSAVRMRGFEASYSRSWNAWTTGAQWSWLEAINEETGKQLDRRPKQTASIALGYQWSGHQTRAELLMVSSRLNNSGASTLPGYAVVNLSDRWKLASNWTLIARVDNVFDTRYVLVANGAQTPYATPARSGYLTLRYTMN
ncbi:MAG: TonB-dependent receptor [Limnohabitans sp.]|nr:MAG: TonB-dependent receptor [Limnohabitans sp.]